MLAASVSSISIHAPHEGERLSASWAKRWPWRISIHAPHEGERPVGMFIDGFAPWISIHAPHEGERPPLSYLSGQRTYFNPRSPRGGATMSADDIRELEDIFQSTLPTRGSDATPWPTCAAEHRKFQSTLPTRGSDPVMRSKASLPDRFQSTLPTRGSDEAAQSMKGSILYFNPRSPRGGATCYARLRMARGRIISIHAPHEGERRRC